MFDLFHNLKCLMTHQKRAKRKLKKTQPSTLCSVPEPRPLSSSSSSTETSGVNHSVHFITIIQILLEPEWMTQQTRNVYSGRHSNDLLPQSKRKPALESRPKSVSRRVILIPQTQIPRDVPSSLGSHLSRCTHVTKKGRGGGEGRCSSRPMAAVYLILLEVQ